MNEMSLTRMLWCTTLPKGPIQLRYNTVSVESHDGRHTPSVVYREAGKAQTENKKVQKKKVENLTECPSPSVLAHIRVDKQCRLVRSALCGVDHYKVGGVREKQRNIGAVSQGAVSRIRSHREIQRRQIVLDQSTHRTDQTCVDIQNSRQD